MGYDIHITRKENWFDENDSNEIKLTEWTDYIKSDKEMRLDNQASATTDNGDQVTYENNGLAVWTSYSKNGLGDNYAWFDFRAGNVTVKNPDEEIKNKMIDIADRLNAKVQGDDGETYDTKVLSRDNPVKTDKRPWWKFWK
jgi:hypothetical protein